MAGYFKTSYLLRVNDYEFEDGGADRDKYLIVLNTNEDETYIVHCLTTSNNRFNLKTPVYGCNDSRGTSYWVFPAKQSIGSMNYSFEKDTYVFFLNNIRKCPTSKFDLHISRG